MNMSNRRPEGGRQVSALLNEDAWTVFAREGANRRGGHFLSACILFWEGHGPHVKSGAWQERDALIKRTKHLGNLIAQYIEARKQVELELERVQAELDELRVQTQNDAKTEQD